MRRRLVDLTYRVDITVWKDCHLREAVVAAPYPRRENSDMWAFGAHSTLNQLICDYARVFPRKTFQ